MALQRTTFTVPDDLVRDLAYLSKRVGVSRSALVSSLLTQPVHDLRHLVEQIPESPTPADVRRLRGESEKIVHERLEALKGLEDDLFGSA